MFNWFLRARDYYFALPRLKFEALTLGIAVLIGLLAMPPLIYLVGTFTLQKYAHGGVFAFYLDFFKGLIALHASFWVVVAGPFVFLTLVRIFRFVLRKL